MTGKSSRLLLALAPLIISAGSCSADNSIAQQYEHSGSAMGTLYSVSVVESAGIIDLRHLQDDIAGTLQRIEALMSTYDPDSELSKFNASASTDWHPVSAELCSAIEHSLQIARQTEGTYDPTVGPLVNLWGFGPAGSIQEPPEDADIAKARERTGFAKLETNCPKSAIRKTDGMLYVDLSAYAKGLAVDKIAELLNRNDVGNYLVEIGGEVRARGHNKNGDSWRIAIEKPAQLERSVQRIVSIGDMAMATSGDYRNFFESGGKRYSHTIDPRTGRPVSHQLAAVTVIGKQAALADALATALLVMGPVDGPEFAERHSIAALFLVYEQSAVTENMTTGFEKLLTH